MSGDVQPRRRKDKKRKKDEGAEQTPFQAHVASTGIQNEDLNIHVHKENGTGGGICAKIVFFLLFSALAVLIGLIMIEHRGVTDLDSVDSESRFSILFEGWVDNNIGHDEQENVDSKESSLEDDDRERKEKIEDSREFREHDISEENEQDEEEEEAEKEEEEEEEEAEKEDEDEEDQTEEDDRNLTSEEASQISEDEEEDEENEEEEEEESEDEGEEEDSVEEEETAVDEDENESEIEDTAEDEDEEEDIEDLSDEDEQTVEQSVEDKNDDSDEGDEEPTVIEEGIASNEEEEENEKKETDDQNEEIIHQVEEELKEGEEQEPEQNSKMVVKIGVGVALLVVAHVVLVRKWKSASPPDEAPKTETVPDLSRRNTIVIPPEFQEIEKDIEDVEEEYSDEDGEVESDEERVQPKSAKVKYQELRTTYTRSLTPESEPEYRPKSAGVDDEEYDEEDEDEEEEDDDEEEEEEEEEDDDEELLTRLEVRYGKLQHKDDRQDDDQFSSWKRVNVRENDESEESDADKQSDVDTYDYENITNEDDFKIKEQIDKAHKDIQNNTAYAIKLFDVLLQKFPSSPRSLYGKAQAVEKLADQRRSNELLRKAVDLYSKILDLGNVPDALFGVAAERSIDRLRFLGHYNGAIDVHYKLISRFPAEPKYKNQLVVSLLTVNRVNKARLLLEDILSKYPDDGFALVHYGFILKTVDNKLNESVSFLQRGISTKAPGVVDGRFYFHLGDALTRLGRTEEAMTVYEEGVRQDLFLSKYQRSLYNVRRLRGRPWWKKQETPYGDLYSALESNWKRIREEGISVLNKKLLFQNESENLKNRGDWKQFELFARGQKNVNNCRKCPFTCKIIESIPDAGGCRRGQTKFSVMHPGTHVWPHCGPTNCRLRVHLGLKVPQRTYIRVAEETRSWREGEVLIFDDSFEHEVWHNGTSFRLVLIVDVWHPELTPPEKRTLSPI